MRGTDCGKLYEWNQQQGLSNVSYSSKELSIESVGVKGNFKWLNGYAGFCKQNFPQRHTMEEISAALSCMDHVTEERILTFTGEPPLLSKEDRRLVDSWLDHSKCTNLLSFSGGFQSMSDQVALVPLLRIGTQKKCTDASVKARAGSHERWRG